MAAPTPVSRPGAWLNVLTAVLMALMAAGVIWLNNAPGDDPVTLRLATAAPTQTPTDVPPPTASPTSDPASTLTIADKNDEAVTYVLNRNTRRFHLPDCASVAQIKEKNRGDFTGTREEAIDMGYVPCGECKP